MKKNEKGDNIRFLRKKNDNETHHYHAVTELSGMLVVLNEASPSLASPLHNASTKLLASPLQFRQAHQLLWVYVSPTIRMELKSIFMEHLPVGLKSAPLRPLKTSLYSSPRPSLTFWENSQSSPKLSSLQTKYPLFPWVSRVCFTPRQVSNIHSWAVWSLTLTSIPGMILEQAIKQSICNPLGNHKVDRATRKAFRTAGYTRWI